MEKLVSVPGVDAVMVGPKDLSCNLDIPEQWDNPKFLNAIDKIIEVSRRHNVGVGIHYSFSKATQRQVQVSQVNQNLKWQ